MRAIFVTTAAVALLAPAAAHAAGGGLTASYGGQGATSPNGTFSYVAVPAGRDSVIQKLHDGGVDQWRTIKGQFGVPQVTYAGSKTGLSADGSTLVLSEIPNTYPLRRTRLLVLDAHTLKIEQRIALKGFYSVDAVSPDGRHVYLVHYTKPTSDPNAYEVVAYDRRDGRRQVIMDPDEPDEAMSGMPLSRVTSADGRYEFTLYDNADEPFIHMLDTSGKTAECIDLPQLQGRDLSRAALRLDGGTVAIGDLARLDPETQEVTLASAAPVAASTPRVTATPAPPAPEDTSAWPFVALGLAAIAALAFLVVRRRHSVHEVIDLEVTAHHADEQPALRE
jgi:MYXO-CTERM domain-containing protein